MKKTGIILLITAFSITFNATSSFAQLDDSSELESHISSIEEDRFNNVEESTTHEIEVEVTPEIVEEISESPSEEAPSESSSLDSAEEVLTEPEAATSQIDTVSSATRTLNVVDGLLITPITNNGTLTIHGDINYSRIKESLPENVKMYETAIMKAFSNQSIDLIVNGQIVKSALIRGTGYFSMTFNKPFVGGTKLVFRMPLITLVGQDQIESYIKLEDTIIVVPGEAPQTLAFNSVPPTFNFNPINFSYSTPSVTTQQQSSFNIEILDTRPNGQWTLAARLAQPLTNVNAHTIPTNLLYGNVPLTSTPVNLAKSTDNNVIKNDQLATVTLGKVATEKFNLQFDPKAAQAGTTYKLAIEWTLSNTASN